jgi:hypothetical protein
MKIIGNDKTDDELAFEILFRKYYVRLCAFANKFIANKLRQLLDDWMKVQGDTKRVFESPYPVAGPKPHDLGIQ